MKIGFVTTYSAKHPAGLERCTLDLLKAVFSQDHENQYYVYTKKGSGLAVLLAGYCNVRVIEIGLGKFWKDIGLFLAPRADVYIFNGPQVPLLFAPKRYVVIVYDFGYHQFFAPGLRSYAKKLFLDGLARLAFRRSQKILAISQHTKSEIGRLFATAEHKITVMHLGFIEICSLPPEPINSLPPKFFLFVGTLKERKNPLQVVRAFAEFCKQHTGYSLLFVGKPSAEKNYLQKIYSVIIREGIGDRVKFLGHINDSQLAYVYSRALALVFPSFIEGFGFPILEAASCGLPVITSNQSSLQEIAGGAALLVDPHNSDSIKQAMVRIATDAPLREQLIQSGRSRAREFSWNKTAQKFMEVLKSQYLS